ncbi:MAG: chromosome segregation protein SMC, partial [Gammaproteobacteria bacterium]
EQEQQLKALLSQRLEVEASLTEARAEVHNLEAGLREKDQARLEHENGVGELREEQATLQLAQQEVAVRAQTVDEQISGTGFERDELLKNEEEQVTIAEGEERVARLERQISRLGAINLAAIDEYEEQKERKEYLDRQFEDVTSALETLEEAMCKIDKETRHRFKDTFERVNVRLQEVYPQLFGGGLAHLELTGTDLLTTGVAVMARPPGKRLSTIHLLSGGEKALTAVALVFAIFELNPAPFCMLDEVDAPLDEANVGRFCELVRGMGERVQFIVITHNKTTMEFLDQLIGVTMQEAGVSRLVAVDIEEAAQMAAG